MTVIGLVLSCEHASWTLPPGVDLGVPPDVLQSQAGWDHGAFDIASRLSESVGLPVHAGAFTRMFVDLNRAADHPDVIPRCRTARPCRATRTSPAAIARRASRCFISRTGTRSVAMSPRASSIAARCLHFSSHSFDPSLDPRNRTFDVGVLYDPAHPFEADLAERLMFALRAAGLAVRANQPYSGVGPAVCTSLRNENAGKLTPASSSRRPTRSRISTGGCARVAAAIVPFLESLQLPS